MTEDAFPPPSLRLSAPLLLCFRLLRPSESIRGTKCTLEQPAAFNTSYVLRLILFFSSRILLLPRSRLQVGKKKRGDVGKRG